MSIGLSLDRTHRQRTQGYIKELEKEVLRLREREATLEEQNNQLQAHLYTLQQSYNVPDMSSMAMQPSVMVLAGPSKPMPQLHLNLSSSSMPRIPNVTSGDMNLDQGLDVFTPRSLGIDSIPDLSTTGTTTPSLTVDLTELGRVHPHKWCSVDAATSFDLPWIRPDPKISMVVDPVVPSLHLTMDSQLAIDFVLEYVICSFEMHAAWVADRIQTGETMLAAYQVPVLGRLQSQSKARCLQRRSCACLHGNN
jgi:hypothetical protein